jgi:predicted heme/steroid binding protein
METLVVEAWSVEGLVGWCPSLFTYLSDDQLTEFYQRGPISLTEEELAKYNGVQPDLPIYIALNGSIYDVSAGQKTYGPGGSYHFFAGRDAARAFITGCFQEDLTSDLRGVEAMYIPKEAPDAEAKLSKRELKLRRERERRAARKQVKDTIDGWAKVFRGETGRPYFWIGEIKREKDWLDNLPPPPKLCQAAEDSRPKRDDAKDTTEQK